MFTPWKLGKSNPQANHEWTLPANEIGSFPGAFVASSNSWYSCYLSGPFVGFPSAGFYFRRHGLAMLSMQFIHFFGILTSASVCQTINIADLGTLSWQQGKPNDITNIKTNTYSWQHSKLTSGLHLLSSANMQSILLLAHPWPMIHLQCSWFDMAQHKDSVNSPCLMIHIHH